MMLDHLLARLARLAGGLLAAAFLFPTALLGGSAAATPAAGPGPAAVAGHWEGAIEQPGSPMAIKVDLMQEHGSWCGRIVIPSHSLKRGLREIEIDGARVHFAMKAPRNPTFDGKLADGEIRGIYTHLDTKQGFHLRREGDPDPEACDFGRSGGGAAHP